jgi:2-phosphosulfolactate phosphatase
MSFAHPALDLRFEWGAPGLAALVPLSRAVIIVDVLSFSTGVSIAVERGASVFPCRWNDQRAAGYAASVQAHLAAPRRALGQPLLSPESPRSLPPGTCSAVSSLFRLTRISATAVRTLRKIRGIRGQELSWHHCR